MQPLLLRLGTSPGDSTQKEALAVAGFPLLCNRIECRRVHPVNGYTIRVYNSSMCATASPTQDISLVDGSLIGFLRVIVYSISVTFNIYPSHLLPEMGTFGSKRLHQEWLAKKTVSCHSDIRLMAHNLEDVFHQVELLVQTTATEQSFPLRNTISSTLSSQTLGNLLEVHEFLSRFQEVLGFEDPLSFEELEKELLCSWPDNADSLETVEVNCSTCIGTKLTTIHRMLLPQLVNVLLDKIALKVNITVDSQLAKPKGGHKKDSANQNLEKRITFDLLPINQLTWPEVVRRYILAYLLMEVKVDSRDTVFRNNNVIRLLQGDGGIYSGSLTGVAGVGVDSLLLGRAVDNVFGKLKRERNTSSMGIIETKGDSSYNCGLDTDGSIPEWAKVLDPVRGLPTNVGARIRNRVREALEKNPPEWAKELLSNSIDKEVYKGNAAGPTKRAVVKVLDRVSAGSRGVFMQSNREKTRKRFALISNVVMKKCRIVLRRVAASDSNKVFCDLVGRNFMISDDSDVKVVFGSASSRPLDLRTIDLRLLHDAYGGSHEAFLEDVREHLWTNLHVTQMNRPSLVQSAEKLSRDFELQYKDEVATLFRRYFEYNINGKFTVEVERELEELLTSLKIPDAPWETGICNVCGLNRDDDHVLLCDTPGCDAPYHTYCLNPPLYEIPKGNWYCPSCALCKQPVDNEPAGHRHISKLVNKSCKEASQILDVETALEETEYWELGAEKRIFMLKFLCDMSLSSALIRQDIDQSGAKLAKVMQKFKALKSREDNLDAEGGEVRRSSRGTAFNVRKGKKHGFAPNIDDDFVEDLYTLSDRENSNGSFSEDHPAKQLSKLSVRREFLGTDSSDRLYWGFPDMSTQRGIIVNEKYGTWCLFQSDEEISSLIDYLRRNDPKQKELRDSILHWQKSMLQGGQHTERSHVVCSADSTKSVSPNDLLMKATSLLEAKYGLRTELDTDECLKKPSRKNMGPKWHRCECLEPILPCWYHCLKCHETFFTNIEFEQHKNCSCSLSSSVEKRKVDISTRNFSVPQSSLKPIVGKAGYVFRQLKINLLDMEAALPGGARRASRASSEWRSAWCAFVKSTDTIYEMVEATIMLETMIKTEYINNTWWWYWSSVVVAAKTATMLALALRIYTLDAAIDYQKVNASSAQQSRKRREEAKEPRNKAVKKPQDKQEINDS